MNTKLTPGLVVGSVTFLERVDPPGTTNPRWRVRLACGCEGERIPKKCEGCGTEDAAKFSRKRRRWCQACDRKQCRNGRCEKCGVPLARNRHGAMFGQPGVLECPKCGRTVGAETVAERKERKRVEAERKRVEAELKRRARQAERRRAREAHRVVRRLELEAARLKARAARLEARAARLAVRTDRPAAKPAGEPCGRPGCEAKTYEGSYYCSRRCRERNADERRRLREQAEGLGRLR